MNADGIGLISVARLDLGIHEAGPNRGLRVEAVQHWSGGSDGDSWCMEMVWMWVDRHLGIGIESWFPRQQSVEHCRQFMKAKGWEVEIPMPGDLVVSVADDHGHHIGVATVINPVFTTIAGNTSADGTSSNGDRVAEHPVSLGDKEFYRVPGVIA